MALSLKINLVSAGVTKQMKFPADMSVSEMAKEIRDKTNVGGADHGIFQPALNEKQKPRWLRPDRTLRYYDLQSGMELEYKKKHRTLKIRLLDGTVKTVLVDDSSSVTEITEVIGKKMGIQNPEEFSLKLQNTNKWLNPAETLTGQGVTEDDVILLKKKFFFNDANVDRSDPVQLHLLYVQSVDAVVSGDLPTTREEARDLAALQLQVTYKDFNPQRHSKPGFFKPKEFIPPPFRKTNFEKEIIKEYQKLINMSEINAKYRYIQLCRSLKTYGVTFFACKIKLKKKMQPRLLGITRQAILVVDPETRITKKEYPLTHLKRWAASATSFTLDFGDYEDDYVSVLTDEGESISQLISGYIDIILKTRKDAARILEDGDGDVAVEEQIAPIRGTAYETTTTSLTTGGFDPNQGQQGMMGMGGQVPGRTMLGGNAGKMINVTDVATALAACSQLVDMITDPATAIGGADVVSLGQAMSALGTAAGTLATAAPSGGEVLDKAAQGLHKNLLDLIAAAKKAAGEKGDDVSLLDGAKAISEAVRKMLQAAGQLAENPNDVQALEAMRAAQIQLKGAMAYLGAASAGQLTDTPSQSLLLETAKMVAAATAALIADTEEAAKAMSGQNQANALNKSKALSGAAQRVISTATMVAPALLNPKSQDAVVTACKALQQANQALLEALSAGGVDDAKMHDLSEAAKRVGEAIAQLMSSAANPGKMGSEPQDFVTPYETITKNVKDLNQNSKNNPIIIGPSTAAISDAVQQLIQAAKVAAVADPEAKNDLLKAAHQLMQSLGKLNDFSKKAAANPNDAYSMQQLKSNANIVQETAGELLRAGRKAVMDSVQYWAKASAASASGLVATAISCSQATNDPNAKKNLVENATNTGTKINQLVDAINACAEKPDDLAAKGRMIAAAKAFAPPTAQLVAVSKRSIPAVSDLGKKTALNTAADDVANSLGKLMLAVNAAGEEGPSKEVAEALQQLGFITADLDAAQFAAEAGALPRIVGGNPDTQEQLLTLAAQTLRGTLPPLSQAAKKGPEALGPPSKATSGAVYQVVNAAKSMASFAPDAQKQKQIIVTSKELVDAGQILLQAASALSKSPQSVPLQQGLQAAEEDLENTLQKILNVSRGVDTAPLIDASSTLEAEANRIGLFPGQGSNFETDSDALVAAAKALAATCNAVANSAENNPKALVPSAQMTVSAVSPFVNAANRAASSCPDKESAQKIVQASKDIANGSADVVDSAKDFAQSGGSPESKQMLAKAVRQVNDAVQDLINALGSAQPGQKEAKKALADVNEALNSLDLGGKPPKGTSLDKLNDACKQLGQATHNIVTVSRTEPKKLGEHSLQASNALGDIVDAARTALGKMGGNTSLPPDFAKPAARIVEALDKLEAGAKNDRRQAAIAAKVIAMGVTDLVAASKRQAIASGNSDPTAKRNLIMATEKLADATTDLAKSARGGIRDHHIAGTRAALHELSAAVSAQRQTDPATEQLIAATRTVADATMKLVSGASAVCGNPKDNGLQNKLRSAAKAMPQAIAAIQNAAMGLNPGVRECDSAISELENALGELEAAGIASAFGQLEELPGKTHQDCTQELIGLAKALSSDVGLMRKDDPKSTAEGASRLQGDIPAFVAYIKGAAATTSNRETQQQLIELAKNLSENMLGLLNACRSAITHSGDADVDGKATAVNESIKAFAAGLATGASNLRDLEDAINQVSQLGKLLDSNPSGKSYQQSKMEIKKWSKDVVKDTSDLVGAAKQNVNDIGSISKLIASSLPNLLEATRDAAGSSSDNAAKANLIKGGKEVVTSMTRILDSAKKVVNDPKNKQAQKDLVDNFTKVTGAITSVLDACYAGAVGERECEDAAYQIGRIIADLDASSLFAAAGQVDPNEIAPGKNYSDCQQEVKASAATMKLAAGRFQDAIRSGSQDDLAAASREVAKQGGALAQYTKAAGALGGDKAAQQSMIDACKKAEIEAQNLLNKGRNNFGKNDAKGLEELKQAYIKLDEKLQGLVTAAQKAADESAKGIVEIDKANRFIGSLMENYGKPSWQGNKDADAEEIVKSARALAAATGELVVGCGTSQEDLVSAVKQAATATKVLLENAKGGGKTTTEPDVRNKLDKAALDSAKSISQLLEACKTASKSQNLQSQALLSNSARKCADDLQMIVAAANLLPGGRGLTLEEDTGEDLDALAEKELQACAQVIDNAAKTLLNRPKKSAEGETDLEGIHEAILTAAIAIAQATGVLVRAAHTAQKDRVAKGQNPKTKHLYRKDPTWANGLISAAQKVAATTQHMVGSANSAVQGDAEEEVLVASAHAVAASTAQLVSASRAKATPGSKIQKALDNAAKGVAASTSQLVEAVRAAAEADREAKMMDNKYTLDSSAKAEMEQQIEILRLEKELADARQRLLQNRKNQYQAGRGGRPT